MITISYENTAMKKSAVYKWYKRFNESKDNLGDDERNERLAAKMTCTQI